MSRRSKTVFACAAVLGIASAATSAFLITRAAPKTQEPAPATQNKRTQRSLLLQPEAFRVSRQLGKRFETTGRGVTTSVGNLTSSGSQQLVSIVRRQTDAGERVEFAIGTRELMWSDQEGIKAIVGIATPAERLLAERLVLDSPDQFVLAQLRGASYLTVAQNVRPNEAGDDYKGPLWNVVRLDEPSAAEENLRPKSTWRLYYINTLTGLPDRIEYQLDGQEIRTDFVEWTEQNGEKTPSHTTWSSGGQLLLEYRTVNISYN